MMIKIKIKIFLNFIIKIIKNLIKEIWFILRFEKIVSPLNLKHLKIWPEILKNFSVI